MTPQLSLDLCHVQSAVWTDLADCEQDIVQGHHSCQLACPTFREQFVPTLQTVSRTSYRDTSAIRVSSTPLDPFSRLRLYLKQERVYAGTHGLWDALDRPMASQTLKGVLVVPDIDVG